MNAQRYRMFGNISRSPCPVPVHSRDRAKVMVPYRTGYRNVREGQAVIGSKWYKLYDNFWCNDKAVT